MSYLNESVSREILYINDRLSNMPEIFTQSNGLLEYLVEYHNLDRGELITKDLSMRCILNRYQFFRGEGSVVIDVRSNHHHLENNTTNFQAHVVDIKVILNNRVHEPLLRSLDRYDPIDCQVRTIALTFLRALLPDAASNKPL